MTDTYSEYTDLADFENLILEESFVLDIVIRYRVVKFKLDMVLSDKHELYAKPPDDEIFCYRSAGLIFSDVEVVNWTNLGLQPASDISGEIDFGNIDSLRFKNNKYAAEGDWGKMEITSSIPKIIIY